jgi:dTDP-4-amino-4,6-dideoxygalactose transaminase
LADPPPLPLVDLRAQHEALRPALEAAFARVLDRGAFVLGEEVAAFEEEFAAYCGVAHAVAVNSGTSALHLALLAAGVGPGDEVVTVPFTFIATAAAIRYAGATPVFADIDPGTFTLDPARLEAAITPRTKAVLPVHLYGQTADMDAIGALATGHGLAVIEDAAQAHGAEQGGRRAGALGALGCFSFYPTKNLGALGEGGIVTTDDAQRARALRLLRDWGQERKYEHRVPGFNARMEGLQGAVLRVKLGHLEAWTEARRAHAAAYGKALEGCGVVLPVERPGRRHVYHVYTVRAGARARLREGLAARGIATGIHYPIPLHLQPALADLGHRPGDFPAAEAAAREVLSLPLYPELPEGAPERVAAAIREVLAG